MRLARVYMHAPRIHVNANRVRTSTTSKDAWYLDMCALLVTLSTEFPSPTPSMSPWLLVAWAYRTTAVRHASVPTCTGELQAHAQGTWAWRHEGAVPLSAGSTGVDCPDQIAHPAPVCAVPEQHG